MQNVITILQENNLFNQILTQTHIVCLLFGKAREATIQMPNQIICLPARRVCASPFSE
jgi:hypothetical protein